MKIKHYNRLLTLIILGLTVLLIFRLFYLEGENVAVIKDKKLIDQDAGKFFLYCKETQKKKQLFVIDQESNNQVLDNLIFNLNEKEFDQLTNTLANQSFNIKQIQMINDKNQYVLLLILQNINQLVLAKQFSKNNYSMNRKIKWLGYIDNDDDNLALLQLSKQKIETTHVWQWLENENIFIIFFDEHQLVYWQAGELSKLSF